MAGVMEIFLRYSNTMFALFIRHLQPISTFSTAPHGVTIRWLLLLQLPTIITIWSAYGTLEIYSREKESAVYRWVSQVSISTIKETQLVVQLCCKILMNPFEFEFSSPKCLNISYFPFGYQIRLPKVSSKIKFPQLTRRRSLNLQHLLRLLLTSSLHPIKIYKTFWGNSQPPLATNRTVIISKSLNGLSQFHRARVHGPLQKQRWSSFGNPYQAFSIAAQFNTP